MLCVEVLSDGSLFAIDPQPVDTIGCAYVLVSGADVLPWALTIEQGQQIGVAIITVWAIAFCFRAVARALSTADNQGD